MRPRTSALLVDADQLGDELRAAGLAAVVVTSPRTRLSREYFADLCDAAGVPAERCLFVATEDRDVRAARAAGLSAFRWTGPADVPYLTAAMTDA
jgi:putative hydrolase of the HAD superfamily